MSERKTLRDWLNFYNKVLTDGCYTSPCGSVLKLYEDDKVYIRKEMARIEMELKNES